MSKPKTGKTTAATTTTAAVPARKAKRVAVSDIPEVEEYVDLKRELDSFKAEHETVFIQFADMVDRYNTALEAAEIAVRAKGVTCGPFENFSISTKIDATKMLEELGMELFHEVGGKSIVKTVYEVDSAEVKAAIASQKIPPECVPNFVKESPSYHVPVKINAS